MSSKFKNMKIEEILHNLPYLQEKVASIQETLIANLIMLSEVPAPTFQEEKRIKLFMQRMYECGLQNVSSDEAGNGVGILPGEDDKNNILLVAHADCIYPDTFDPTLSVRTNEIIGPGVADNSLGLAVLATLPTLLEKLNIRFNANLVLLGSTKGLGRGDLDGLRFFMEHNKIPFSAGICVEGAQLGRLSYTSQGMFRGEIICEVSEKLEWNRLGEPGAIIALNEVINHILEIPIPRRPKTSIVLGSIRAGKSYNVLATNAVLRFEVRSEDSSMVERIRSRIEEIVTDVAPLYSAHIEFQVVSSREPGGIHVGHPLVRNCRKIMSALGLTPRINPSISELSVLINSNLPAVTLGVTEAMHLHDANETILINPMYKGLTQLLAVLLAIDGGCCNESR